MGSRVKLQSQNSALLIGYGYVAQRLAQALLAQGYHVIATYRDTAPTDTNITFVKFGSAVMREAFQVADLVVTSVPPGPDGDPALVALKGLATQAQWIGYLSATSVYGDRGGQWAFEEEPPTPSLKRGKARADAELSWIETAWPVHIFRLAGIYGPGRAPFERLRQGKARAVIKPGHVVNRIHVDDIVSVLLASIAAPNPLRIYNVADGNPAPPQDVLDHAAEMINAPISAPNRR
ncbi:SDR family NAD(P)-dependent oxidoreductase [Litorimonas sp. RW-G-Af-16]|uniref:SDR family NAD(P)-dependent oxidoreductase n=1 Tax=Litorimonas sp. RW-G-Af-16 TaxID=3241168 RepID=UPI003AAD289B